MIKTSHRTTLAAVLLAAAPAFAQTAAERLHAIAEEMIEREFDLSPARETFAEGAGPRAGRTIVDLSLESDERYRSLYSGVLKRLQDIPASGGATLQGRGDQVARALCQQQLRDYQAERVRRVAAALRIGAH